MIKLWKTKDGKKVHICDMTDSHLSNAIRFLERKVDLNKFCSCPQDFQGDMAQYCADQGYLSMLEAEPDYFYPIYRDLYKEAIKRGLKV